jgi:hypothetical protein
MASIGPGLALGVGSGILDTILITQNRSIAGIFPDVTIEENHLDELEITNHPVEQGATISDHAFKRPVEVVMRVGWSPSRAIGSSGDILGDLASRVTDVTGRGYIQDAYNQLLDLQEALEPFDVVTGKRNYSNMLLQGLSVTTDKTSENMLMVEARFREVIIVQTQVTTLPPIANQAIPQQTGAIVNQGTQQPQPVNKSILSQIFGGGS